MKLKWKWILLLVLAGLTSCSKKEEPKAPETAVAGDKSVLEQQTIPIETASDNYATVMSEASDLETVGEQTEDFQKMLDFMSTSAGGEGEINANRVDMESFVQGKSEQELMNFAKAVKEKSPFAAMQVLTWLLENSKNAQILLGASSQVLFLLPECGYEKDRLCAMEALGTLEQIYAEPESFSNFSSDDRDRLLTVVENNLVLLGLDSEAWQQIADHVRKYAQSDLDLSYADSIESAAIIRRGQAGEASRLRVLHQSIIDRGIYGKRVTPESSQYWLSLNDKELEEELMKGAEKTSFTINSTMDEWSFLSNLSEDERLEIINNARKQERELGNKNEK